MAAVNNPHVRGFTWHASRDGSANPVIRRGILASAFRPTLTVSASPNYVDLRVGDPIVQLSDGTFDIAAGAESDTPATKVHGIVMGFNPLYNAASGVMEPSRLYPAAGITWGTNETRRSEVLFCPVDTAYWRVDCDENTTATTEATYRAYRGEQLQHIFNHAQADADTMVDISGHATTSAFLWRIMEFSAPAGDFAGTYVKAIVICNHPQLPLDSATGV